jgi:hypothetical protein
MAIKIPFFHYTHLDNLLKIIETGEISSRKLLETKSLFFKDVSIDPIQETRNELGLTSSLPLFAGYYKLFRNYELNGYLQRNYDDPKLQNIRFFGSLHKTIREKYPEDYPKMTILLLNFEKICQLADEGKVKLFDDLAIKIGTIELDASNRNLLLTNINKCIIQNERKQNDITCEVDVQLNTDSLIFPNDVEAIIVNDNEIWKSINIKIIQKYDQIVPRKIEIFIDPLPT